MHSDGSLGGTTDGDGAMDQITPHRHSFWARLSHTEQAAVRRAGVRTRHEAGSILCHQGDETHHVLIVLSGHVRVSRLTPDGREFLAGVRGPGEVLGELAALDARPRSATLSALVDVETLNVPGVRFAKLCQTEPGIAWVLLGVMVERLRETGRLWAEFGGGHSGQRIAARLLELAVRHGKQTRDGVEVALRGGQQELASAAGTSRESVARALRSLRGRGLVSTRRGHVVVHDLAELRRLAR
jgi:CRP-like cAMP-binding protein